MDGVECVSCDMRYDDGSSGVGGWRSLSLYNALDVIKHNRRVSLSGNNIQNVHK